VDRLFSGVKSLLVKGALLHYLQSVQLSLTNDLKCMLYSMLHYLMLTLYYVLYNLAFSSASDCLSLCSLSLPFSLFLPLPLSSLLSLPLSVSLIVVHVMILM